MKIVYILNATTTTGGATKSFINMMDHMLSHGNEVLVVTPEAEGIYLELKRRSVPAVVLKYYPDIKYPNTPRQIIRSAVRQTVNFKSAISLKKICRDFNPDIIHSNTSVNNIGYLVAKWLDIPHVWHIREYGDKDFSLKIRNIDNRLLARNNYSIAITKDIARHRHVLGLKNNRVIYNGIVSEKHGLESTPKENYFLYAGRLEPKKGFQDCVKAFIRFKKATKSAYKLYLIGRLAQDAHGLKADLQKGIIDNSLENDIFWIDENPDISGLMAKAAAVIVPSLSEGFGRVMPEAMSLGSLVVGRDCAGTKEQFDNGLELTGHEIGLRFQTVDELCGRMSEIVENGVEHYRDMIDNAFIAVNQLYTKEQNGCKVLQFYKEIAHGII